MHDDVANLLARQYMVMAEAERTWEGNQDVDPGVMALPHILKEQPAETATRPCRDGDERRALAEALLELSHELKSAATAFRLEGEDAADG